ncbi:MAG: inositol monophosphatase family protein [Gammaproteobacteria bacterium]
MSSPRADELVEFYLPVLVAAGDYARQIQPRIAAPPKKSGANEWTQALTDADIMVQSFIEVATLAQHPGVGFYGEESEHSTNAKYFDRDADTVVYLDPINGTFLYQNQQTSWDIILSIVERGRISAAISYMPVSGRFYLATDGAGALTGDRECRRLEDFSPLTTVTGSNVCLTYQARDIMEDLSGEFDCFDIVEHYDPERALDNLNDLFLGRLDAFACRDCEPLDWGAIAFIVAKAGGRASHPDGTALNVFEDFDPVRSTDMVVASSPNVHERILRLLRS